MKRNALCRCSGARLPGELLPLDEPRLTGFETLNPLLGRALSGDSTKRNALCRRFGVWISGEALPRGGLRLAWRADFRRASFAGRTALSAAALVRGFPVEPFAMRAVAGRF